MTVRVLLFSNQLDTSVPNWWRNYITTFTKGDPEVFVSAADVQPDLKKQGARFEYEESTSNRYLIFKTEEAYSLFVLRYI
jgi:hypothetical protein